MRDLSPRSQRATLEDGTANVRADCVCSLYENEEEKMIPITQTITYDPTPGAPLGNCWQTAIASVLELELDDVPHFVQVDEDGGDNWYYYTWFWLWYRGHQLVSVYRHLYNNEYYLVTGKSPRGDFHHVVVYQNGKMVHDPHPDGTGLLTEETFEVIRIISSNIERE